MELAKKGLSSTKQTKTIEDFWMYWRTVGDAYYGLGEIEKATMAYKEILPDLAKTTGSLYIDLEWARNRAGAIDRGLSGEDYLKTAAL